MGIFMNPTVDLKKLMKTYRMNVFEVDRMSQLLGKSPEQLHPVVWSVFSALWSEHCSYKSSKSHLKKFAKTLNSKVLSPEGENAGILDLGQGERLVFKMESHNHPSFIEPYQGAATGVGGILRDIFTMGARPIASANYLCFGDEFQKNKRMQVIVDGVVRGIAGYGNAVGVPTVTGQTNFDSGYTGNILVNAMAVGLLQKNDPIALSGAKGVGNWVVYVGAKTGRDGIHGASMASEAFSDDLSAKKPNVQIGDPFFEKLLIESCLEVLKENLVVAIQDMGAAGLTSSSFEMAAKGQVGFNLDLQKVPVRDQSISPDEILLSESQERMLLIAEPRHFARLANIFESWGLDAVKIGEVISNPEIEIYWGQEKLAALNPSVVIDGAPRYERPYSSQRIRQWPRIEEKPPVSASELQNWLLQNSLSIHHCAKTAIYQQYDQRVGLKTMRGANYDVAVLRLPDSGRALAMNVGCRPWLMKKEPGLGSLDAVLYPALQMSIKGFEPVGITDCLNFGNPEQSSVMSEFVESVENIARASRALAAPVISGNVSLYNETQGQSIPSTPAIGVLGIRPTLEEIPEDRFLKLGSEVLLVSFEFTGNQLEKSGHLKSGSVEDLTQWMKVLRDLTQSKNSVLSSQCVGRGGLALSLLKMCRRGFGFLGQTKSLGSLEDLWNEVFYQVILVCEPGSVVQAQLQARGLSVQKIGLVQADYYEWTELVKLDLKDWIKKDKTALRSQIETLA